MTSRPTTRRRQAPVGAVLACLLVLPFVGVRTASAQVQDVGVAITPVDTTLVAVGRTA